MAGDGNSWEKPAGNFSSHKHLGKLTIIPGDDWDSNAVVNDSSVSDTWEEADFSAYVPSSSVNGVLVFAWIRTSNALDQMSLLVRGDGQTGGAGSNNTALYFEAEIGASYLVGSGVFAVYAPGGIFDYRRASSSFPIDVLNITLRGYYT